MFSAYSADPLIQRAVSSKRKVENSQRFFQGHSAEAIGAEVAVGGELEARSNIGLRGGSLPLKAAIASCGNDYAAIVALSNFFRYLEKTREETVANFLQCGRSFKYVECLHFWLNRSI